MIYTSVSQLIGGTPLFEAKNIEEELNLKARLLLKLELFNPTGSAKDRAAQYIIEDAEKAGLLGPGSVIVESTSGNTGIGLASIAASKGYKAVIIMPDSMSQERIKLMKAYGAEVVLSDGSKGMSGSLEKLEEVKKQYPGCFVAGQFVNPSNTKAHFCTTGPEIWEDCGGEIDYFVAGVGTGGTISGVGEFLKSKKPAVKIAAVEPVKSPMLSKGISGSHGLQGIGANFIPEILNTEIYDEIISIDEASAYEMARLLGRREGLMTGISSGAALKAAVIIAQRPENEGKTVVALLPDSGDRYLSTELY